MDYQRTPDSENHVNYDVKGEKISLGQQSNNNGESNTEETDLDADSEPVTELLLPKDGYNVQHDAYSHGEPGNCDVHGDVFQKRNSSTNNDEENNDGRETWDKKIDFLLSVIGFAVDLGNVWRFPYICYKNGGGAFLIPYFLMLIFLGLPLFYMELALGQFHRSGAIMIWKHLCPIFTGVGLAICLVATYVGMYYNTIIAWALYYLIASFRSEVPWASCNNDWNTPQCLSMVHTSNETSINQTNPSALEYFYFSVLEAHKSTGIDNIGGVKWSLCLCLLAVMATIYFALWKGIKSSGKAVWVTATVPYVVLLVLLVRGATLPGAGDGVRYYVTPVWSKLLESGVWLDAAAQIFFSLGPGFGTLLALSSYNKFNNNCYMDAMLTATINCLTSLLAGFVVFSVLGYMAHRLNLSIEELAVEGPGLVFYVYPEAIATLSGSVFWAIIFFVLLITLGLDSSFGGLESVITAVCDISPRLANRRKLVVLFVVTVCFLGGLPTTTYGGQYVITLLDTHAAPVALIFICFIEAIAVNWFYGVQRFSNDIEKMLGFQPGLYWKICWAGICPLFLFILFVLSIVAYEGLSLDNYVFPPWSEVVGWLVTVSSLVCIPAYMLYSFVVTPGNLGQKMIQMIQPSVQLQKPEYYRNINGNGVIHMQQSELLPFYDKHKPEMNHMNMTSSDVDNNRTHSHEVFTQNETVDTSIRNFSEYDSKHVFGNGNINMQKECDVSNDDIKTALTHETSDTTLVNEKAPRCQEI